MAAISGGVGNDTMDVALVLAAAGVSAVAVCCAVFFEVCTVVMESFVSFVAPSMARRALQQRAGQAAENESSRTYARRLSVPS